MYKHNKIFAFLILLVFSLLSIYLSRFSERMEILSDYKKLISTTENFQRVQYVLPKKKWKSVCSEETVDIGYASFHNPFGSIDEITTRYTSISIVSENATIDIAPLLIYKDFSVANKKPSEYLPSLTYKGGEVVPRVQRYERYDFELWELEHENPFNFQKNVYNTMPKNSFSLALMNFEKLYLYEKFLEIKNQYLINKAVVCFETEKTRGFVEYAENHTKPCMVLIWDSNLQVYQLIVLKLNKDMVVENELQDKIREFISSFMFKRDVINSDVDLESVVQDVLSKQGNYKGSEATIRGRE